MSQPVCVVVGVGPGNGEAFARKFTNFGYRVALLARSEDYLQSLAMQLEGARGYSYDVTEIEKAQSIFQQIEQEVGTISVLIYNAGAGQFANIDQASLEGFQKAWEVNALGLFAVVKQVLPQMRKLNFGQIVIIGATASLRGGANFLPFASAKAAQRSLAQSLARHLSPEGIHVSYVIIDGVISSPRTHQQMPTRPSDNFLNPEHIAETVFFLTQQPRSAWTFELDLRPFKEKW
ncbi:SDR family NAD(P)-dependent oxidoreductase [Gloeothece verrucosa]|uniref:Short-chain dehydrogenase/reductase SDR n=1 Tax=Gloeothece verrucosa (strain PCC 7822) TaxID=497965 RepID=E0UN03_GLOV7|nr:SDR family NAD(P)-dependent oxidoreductase [Gloeothece verrucosa]ADN18333.1 short-chain dehydrogenase/reductase SDR [Gloeothece verrucosa PCC 7822]